MALFNLFRKNPSGSGPYRNEGLNQTYQLLFCDDIALYKTQSRDYPWDILLADQPDPATLKQVAADKTLESRQRLLAYRLLSTQEPVTQKELLAAVIEVGMPRGLDVLAAFTDGTARYFNHAEKLLVWEKRTTESDSLIAQLFKHSVEVVNRIGTWDKPRLPAPKSGMVRLSFLVSDGLYFGEGPFDAMQNDPMAAPVLNAATQLMAYLTSQAMTKS